MKNEQSRQKIVILNLVVIGVVCLEKTSLTVQEVLRFSNHDLLNHLNLIQMNLDLNRVDEAKQVIHDVAEMCKTFSMTNKLGLPKTSLWLQTFKWQYGAIELHLSCNIETAVNHTWDETIEQYLEKTMIHVYETLDPFVEQKLQLHINSKQDTLMLHFHLQGKWASEPTELLQTKLNVTWHEWSHQSWHYEISLKE